MTLTWKAIGFGVLGTFLVGVMLGWSIERLRIHDAVGPAHTAVVVATDTQHVAEQAFTKADTGLSKILTRWKTRYDSAFVHDTVTQIVPPITDTIWVKEAVALCDSLASSCRAFQDSARAMHRADTALISALRRENIAIQADKPSKLHQVFTYLGVATAGYAAGRVSAGLRLTF